MKDRPVTRRAAAVLAVLGTILVAGCGSRAAPAAAPAAAARTVPLATSLITAQGAWAIAVMGKPADPHNSFWQLFARPAGASRWSLVTPPAVADNGGLVAAGAPGGTWMLVGFRPSQGLTFSPLAMSSDTGQNWTPGLVDAALAGVPDALAVGAPGRILALLHDGTIEQAPGAAAAAAGQWSPLTTLGTLAASAPGRSCGLVAVTAVSFAPGNVPLAAGSCQRPGVAGIFAQAGGTWQAAGPALPAGSGGDQARVLGLAATTDGNAALLRAGTGLLAVWSHGTAWTVSAPVQAAGGIAASGFGPGGSAWVLPGGGRAQTIAGPGASWRALPPLPAGTATLAPGPGGGYDALAVSGSVLTVWRLDAAAWARAQVIDVPIEYGSSG